MPFPPPSTSPPPCSATAAPSEAPSQNASQKRILIVEDQKLDVKLLRDLLELQGYQLYQTAFGLDAIGIAHERHPHLILLNLRLPDVSGLEVAGRLKADEATRAIPIIAVTAFAMREHEAQALEAGCDAYVSKPIRIHDFLKKIEAFLGASAEAELEQV
jgi:two-component system cell cycle response regulator DivK